MLRVIAAFTFVAICLSGVAEARQYYGVVVRVSDGDTLTLRAGNHRRMTIRLSDIDAPEKRQAYGLEAKSALVELVQGQAVVVDKKARDRYKRTVGTVYRVSDGLNVNREQTRRGNAWAYRAYLYDSYMLDLERDAIATGVGLWARADVPPQAPWEWRKVHLQHHPYKSSGRPLE